MSLISVVGIRGFLKPAFRSPCSPASTGAMRRSEPEIIDLDMDTSYGNNALIQKHMKIPTGASAAGSMFPFLNKDSSSSGSKGGLLRLNSSSMLSTASSSSLPAFKVSSTVGKHYVPDDSATDTCH